MVKAKKHLGQHFLKDKHISKQIALSLQGNFDCIVEVGPGTGVLTQHINNHKNFKAVELDNESYEFLLRENILKENQLFNDDFLKMDYNKLFTKNTAIIGNFPYNISSQIMFRVLYYRDTINEVTGMLQKEVAERICSPPGSKTYGILSVLIQAYYSVEYLFSVPPTVFSPPPKVKSGVIRMERIKAGRPDYNEKLFFSVVKSTFNQRRKIISNSLKPLVDTSAINDELMGKRPEQLGVNDFIRLTGLVERFIKK